MTHEERITELARSRGLRLRKGRNLLMYDSLASDGINQRQTTSYWLVDAEGNTLPIGGTFGYQYGVDLEDLDEAFERADRGEGPLTWSSSGV